VEEPELVVVRRVVFGRCHQKEGSSAGGCGLGGLWNLWADVSWSDGV
jgi:hypothetical protein